MSDGLEQEQTKVFFPDWLRYVLLCLSALSFGLGAAATFLTSNDAGAASLLGVAVVLVIVSIFADRISGVEAAGVKLQLLATRQLARADVAEQEGRPEEAAKLRESALSLLEATNPVSTRYDNLRRTMPSSWERTALMETVMHQGRQLASAAASADAVAELFGTGGDGDRIAAIALMQARPELAHPSVLIQAVQQPRSAFEQFQALRAIESAVRHLPPTSEPRSKLVEAVKALAKTDSDLRSNTERRDLVEQILAQEP